MTIEIKAPTFPESIADGTVASSHKQPGQAVSREEVLAEIETDKVVLEIVAPADGTLKEILKAEGDTVLSEEVIAIFVEGTASAAADRCSDAAVAPAVQRAERVSASPAARKLAEERAVDVARIDGSGKSGRVTKEDDTRHIRHGTVTGRTEVEGRFVIGHMDPVWSLWTSSSAGGRDAPQIGQGVNVHNLVNWILFQASPKGIDDVGQ